MEYETGNLFYCEFYIQHLLILVTLYKHLRVCIIDYVNIPISKYQKAPQGRISN